jgi:hypothetical protein
MTNNPTLKTDRVRRTHIIKVRASDCEHACLLEQAGDTAMAVYIRQKLLDGAVVTTKRQVRKTTSKNDRDAGCAVLAREVARVGNNLNQLARAVNQTMKINKPMTSLILGMRLYEIWEQLLCIAKFSKEAKGKQLESIT